MGINITGSIKTISFMATVSTFGLMGHTISEASKKAIDMTTVNGSQAQKTPKSIQASIPKIRNREVVDMSGATAAYTKATLKTIISKVSDDLGTESAVFSTPTEVIWREYGLKEFLRTS